MQSFDRTKKQDGGEGSADSLNVVRDLLEARILLTKLGVEEGDLAFASWSAQRDKLSDSEQQRLNKLLYLTELVHQAKLQTQREMDLSEDPERAKVRIKQIVRQLSKAKSSVLE